MYLGYKIIGWDWNHCDTVFSFWWLFRTVHSPYSDIPSFEFEFVYVCVHVQIRNIDNTNMAISQVLVILKEYLLHMFWTFLTL